MNFYYIFKRELRSYFVSATVYIVVTIFLVLSGYFFYTDLNYYNWVNVRGTFSQVLGLWQFYFHDLRFVFILLIPLITMRLFAEEKKQGTIELLATYPLRDVEILAGKFLACLVVFFLMLVLTFSNVILLGIFWGFYELKPLLAGYLGLFLLGSSLIACGTFVSSLTENQIVAAMATLGLFIFFWFLTWNEMMASPRVIDLLVRFSLFDRISSFFRGVIKTKDVLFFLVFIYFFLFLTLQSLGARRWRGLK